jgi:hypothetical protein
MFEPSGKVGKAPKSERQEGNVMKHICDFSKSSYHQKADGKNTYPTNYLYLFHWFHEYSSFLLFPLSPA